MKTAVGFGSPAFYALSLLALFLGYAIVLSMTVQSSVGMLLGSAAANVLSLLVVGACARVILVRFVFAAGRLSQAAAHGALALAFSVAWFWLLMVLIGAIRGEGVVEFSVTPFRHGAAPWQLFQGIIMYALVALATYAEQLVRQRDAPIDRSAAVSSAAAAPVFVKQEGDFLPLDSGRIILLRGADDYSEIVTEASTHLVRQRLGVLAERLGDPFVRVHRSYVVNFGRIVRAEPAGNGTMQLVMDNGTLVKTSRTGARLLRQLLV